MTVHNVQGGEVLFRQGDIGHHFFIIIHGKVLVWIKPPPDAEDQVRSSPARALPPPPPLRGLR